jgi:hypothetical protein
MSNFLKLTFSFLLRLLNKSFVLGDVKRKFFNFQMENTEFYIKYLGNAAVPIDASYGRGPQQTLPLITVAHLIAAYRPNSLLANTPLELLTLHYGVDGESLRPGLTLAKITNGHTDDNPLIIKSRNDSEQGIEIY